MKTIVAVLALLALSACGSEDASENPFRTSGQPACADVWKPGSTLPSGYEGCMDGDTLVAVVSDSQGKVWFEDRLLAKPGQKITEVK